jgi:hypothetical protein
VGACRSYISGRNCTYGSEECWWSHSESIKKAVKTDYSCNLCAKTFQIRANLMKHQKIDHEDTVNTCNHALKGTCHFGSENCWFRHEEQVITNGDKKNMNNVENNQEVIEKIFDMMEKFTDRIVHIENNI